jgi:GNAT superfamily N-acetyltransferase
VVKIAITCFWKKSRVRIATGSLIFVRDAQREPIRVHFELLVDSDREALLSEPWRSAVFAEVWQEFLDYPQALKLICGQEIVGLLRLGEKPTGINFLRENLLESRPESKLQGIGRVLVARLVAESYNKGAMGQVRVQSHKNAVGFYQHLGFKPNRTPFGYDLLRERAQALFESVTQS